MLKIDVRETSICREIMMNKIGGQTYESKTSMSAQYHQTIGVGTPMDEHGCAA